MTEFNKSDLVGRPMTANYEDAGFSGGLSYWYHYNRRTPLFHPRFVPDMLRDSRINLGLSMIKGPILAASRFYVKDDESEGTNWSPVKKFLVNQITTFWRQSAIKALSAIEWGWSGNEVLYRVKDDLVQFHSLKVLQPNDVKLVTRDGEKIGMTVQNLKSGNRKIYLGGPKAFWHTHARENHPYYGRSRLHGAFQPWIEFYSDGGAKDVRRLYYYKFSFSGEVGYYPANEPATDQGPPGAGPRSNKNIMRNILEKRKAGGHAYFPNTTDANGVPKWRIEPASPGPGAAPILEYHDMLKREMLEGMGVPPEVVEAAEVGSGWSGRMVPATAFFSSLQEIVNNLMFDYDEQVLRSLVMLNFNRAHDYEIIPYGLLQGSDQDEEREKEANAGVTDLQRQSSLGGQQDSEDAAMSIPIAS